LKIFGNSDGKKSKNYISFKMLKYLFEFNNKKRADGQPTYNSYRIYKFRIWNPRYSF